MQLTVRNPKDGVYPATDDYVHAIEVANPTRFLFIAGTTGLDHEGRAPATLEAQLELVWSNVRRILAEADMTTDNIVRITSYLRDAGYAEANQNARLAALGTRRVPTTAIVVQTLTPEWLIELEVIAAG